MRPEQEIFDDLAELCSSPGYIHALAEICFRDTIVGFKGKLTADDMAWLYSRSRLIRTEINTLIGLMMRAPIDFVLPAPDAVCGYIKRSETLLEELHQAIIKVAASQLSAEGFASPEFNPFARGEVLREGIFYSGESAYTFQYRDLVPLKYRHDADWLRQNKGLDLDVAPQACRGIAALLEKRLCETAQGLKKAPKEERTILPGFTFTCEEIAAQTGRPVAAIRAFVEAFAAPDHERNQSFTSLNAFNAASAYPFIRAGADAFVSLQQYGIAEALYETPFYWMMGDQSYAKMASRHRGEFSEQFAFDRLVRVFGRDRVFRNVDIIKSKDETAGEIDVLVLFGNRAIVLQAKSKKLTYEARKGNDLQLQKDFKAAVQDAVDQAVVCAKLLGDKRVTLRCRDGETIALAKRPRTIFPLSIVTDHYPALAFQARQFLKVEPTEQIVAPLVTDVFALDALTEMLSSPLRLLSYLRLRSRIADNFMMSHENTLLGYHLKRNLWIDSDFDMLVLDDNMSIDLDVAMAVRRDGVPGAATPEGILTRFEGTHFARILNEIENCPRPEAINLGLMLLELSEDTVRATNGYIESILALTAADGLLHDATIGISTASTGITVHCSQLPTKEAEQRLHAHCRCRKYLGKADSWFGIAMRPDGSLHIVAELSGAWSFDPEMEEVLAATGMARPPEAGRKIGRNERCPCGSGKKYKHCCIGR